MRTSFSRLVFIVTLAFSSVNAAPSAGPIVNLGYGSFQGTTAGNLDKFLGMPFAAPPVGNLRFAPPQAPKTFTGVRQATAFGSACFQQALSGNGTNAANVSEDCLFINVVKPTSIPKGKKLPVLMWIYGGGFEAGDTSANPGDTVVARSIALGEPVVYVSANYRISALGFLGGKEVKEAGIGNAGLRDQRFAMEWIQSHVETFGGDPTRVTIWGESAGAISVGMHLIVNDGNPNGLFHGAFMESGSPEHLRDITTYQPFFDQLVSNTGCTSSADKIACMRAVPFGNISTAINLSPGFLTFMSINLAWQPSVDGQFIARDPYVSIQKGLYAKVPFVTGDCEDEGTVFSLTSLNITNNAQFLGYMQSNFFPGISPTDLAALSQAYPDDITQGSPFGTGTANAMTPEFKRLAAIQGDIGFQAPRRFLLQTAAKTQPTFGFLFRRGKSSSLGASHGSDIPEFYGTSSPTAATIDFIGTDALVNFANTKNPNLPKNSMSLLSAIQWPEWGSSVSQPPLLTFQDPVPAVNITFDTFRIEGMNLINKISLTTGNNV
ncbi:carotenoid ester lipase precursor [Pholiota conissans]|uniref:Carboxylic ester hydrolase n=1 Tax=Pholiota conissans TaxID=109636 RepID=A0A9P5YRD7_9AGAR|nr:carotenoid ester lipase precursor [Pholiota conissans]